MKERYLALCQEQQTRVESSHEPSSRDNDVDFSRKYQEDAMEWEFNNGNGNGDDVNYDVDDENEQNSTLIYISSTSHTLIHIQ